MNWQSQCTEREKQRQPANLTEPNMTEQAKPTGRTQHD